MYKVMNIPRQIGQVVKERRLEIGLTQVQLAELTNTSRSLIYRLEKGATNSITLDKLFEILKALELEIAILDAQSPPKIIQKITPRPNSYDVFSETKERISSLCKAASRSDSSRNAPTQHSKEQAAIRNIKGLNAEKFLRG